jgi:hypothetical protein
MTYEGPGIKTRSEVKRSIKEGKGKLAIPIFMTWKNKRQVESSECGMVTASGDKTAGD